MKFKLKKQSTKSLHILEDHENIIIAWLYANEKHTNFVTEFF